MRAVTTHRSSSNLAPSPTRLHRACARQHSARDVPALADCMGSRRQARDHDTIAPQPASCNRPDLGQRSPAPALNTLSFPRERQKRKCVPGVVAQPRRRALRTEGADNEGCLRVQSSLRRGGAGTTPASYAPVDASYTHVRIAAQARASMTYVYSQTREADTARGHPIPSGDRVLARSSVR